MSTTKSYEMDSLKLTMNTYMIKFTIIEAGVGPPSDPLVSRDSTGALSFKEQYRLRQGVSVIGAS